MQVSTKGFLPSEFKVKILYKQFSTSISKCVRILSKEFFLVLSPKKLKFSKSIFKTHNTTNIVDYPLIEPF